jgi:hypothetical protein
LAHQEERQRERTEEFDDGIVHNEKRAKMTVPEHMDWEWNGNGNVSKIWDVLVSYSRPAAYI